MGVLLINMFKVYDLDVYTNIKSLIKI